MRVRETIIAWLVVLLVSSACLSLAYFCWTIRRRAHWHFSYQEKVMEEIRANVRPECLYHPPEDMSHGQGR